MTLLKHEDKLNDVMIALTFPAFHEDEMEFIKEYAMVLQPIVIALDRPSLINFCFYGCLLPTLLAIEKS